MDVEEFAREVKPRRKRSRLLPFKDQIQKLKTQGYTDMQIRDWLARNDIEISRESVRKFIKNHLTGMDAEPAPSSEHDASSPGRANLSPAAGDTTAATESQADKMRRQLREQQNEADKNRFKHDKTGNNR